MENFKFSTIQKVIVWTALLPVALFPIYMLLAYIATNSGLDKAFAGIILPMMAFMLISEAINTLLFPVSVAQIVSVFRKTKSYHRWLLLFLSFVGPVVMYFFITGVSNATYM